MAQKNNNYSFFFNLFEFFFFYLISSKGLVYEVYVQINAKMVNWPQNQASSMVISVPWPKPC